MTWSGDTNRLFIIPSPSRAFLEKRVTRAACGTEKQKAVRNDHGERHHVKFIARFWGWGVSLHNEMITTHMKLGFAILTPNRICGRATENTNFD
jgi:hypothetical protein